jgi:hypothetical protein
MFERGPATATLRRVLQLGWDAVGLVIFMLLVYPIARIRRSNRRAWVVSGHKARIYADNSAALHQYITEHTRQRVIWVTCDVQLGNELKARGLEVVTKNSFRARYRIVAAPALIYSHGEDDLDDFLFLLRRLLGVRFYLNHSMNHLKVYESTGLRQLCFPVLRTDFDWLMASSESEKSKFEQSFPDKKDQIVLNGGAHLDAYFSIGERQADKTILYFPTFRDDPSDEILLNQVIEELTSSGRLKQWLDDNQYQFVICHHINSSPDLVQEGAGRIIFAPVGEFADHLKTCALFISDYSGTLVDYLILDSPAIFFPFDLARFVASRNLYVDYEHFCYGPIALTGASLVDLLVARDWHAEDFISWQKRAQLKLEYFPNETPNYAQRSFEFIRGEVALEHAD